MNDDFIKESQKLADEFAEPETLMYRLLQLGFMPHDEAKAVALLKSLCEESDSDLEENCGLTPTEIRELRERNNT